MWESLATRIGAVTPASVARAGERVLRNAGLSQRKAMYLEIIAQGFRDGTLGPEAWSGADDETVAARLVALKGIGRWTAEMFLIFHLMRPDVLPLSDIGLRKAISRHYTGGAAMANGEIKAIAKPWRPWRSVATWYLWRSLDPIPVVY